MLLKGAWFQTTDRLKGEVECNMTAESDPEKEFEDCFEKEGDTGTCAWYPQREYFDED